MTRNEAQRRNWFKARVINIVTTGLDTDILTTSEIDILNKIKQLKEQLIVNWDGNTKKFPNNIKKYKCWCGRKTNVDRKINGEQVCKKHYGEL